MKSRYFELKDGAVVECGVGGTYGNAVLAANKTEATPLLLRKAELILKNRPTLRISNGAFLLVHHDGTAFCAESGTIDRAQFPLCLASHPTERQALADTTFAYYASESYRVENERAKNQVLPAIPA
jgi:hypothetical protein